MSGGIMDIVPREPAILGGIKKAVKKTVKKVTGGIKDIVSSDLGKAALLAAATYKLGGGQFGKLFSGGPTGFEFSNLPGASLFTGGGTKAAADLTMADLVTSDVNKGLATPFLKTKLGKIATLGAVSTFLTKTLGMSEAQAQEELARDPSKYLEQYYRNLNPPTADTNSEQYEKEVAAFVAANTSEYAVGGRVGFAEGTYEDFEEFMRKRSEAMSERQKEELRKQFEMYMRSKDPTVEAAEGGRIGFAEGPVLPPDTTQPVNPFGPKPGDFGIDEDIPIKQMASNMENDKILEALFEKYLDMGLSPKEAEKAARDEFDRMSKKRMEPTIRGVAALGGRMGFDKGTPMGLQGLGSLMDEEMVVIIDYDEDGNPRLVRVPKSEVMKDMKKSLPVIVEDDMVPIVVDDKMDSRDIVIPMDKEKGLEGIVPRDNKARGDTASDNAMQAAGVEGLPIRQNPKGVKELDLRKTGGFIPPVGIKEKADDIPAMLSNNEFVFTADAVRGAGGGNVELGAQRMYDTMKRLEAGGKA